MVVVKFLGPAEIRDAAGRVTEAHAKGAIVDLSPDRARRWIRRGKAEAYVPPAPAAEPSKSDSGSPSRAGKARRSRSSGRGRASPPPTSPDSAAASE